MAARGSKSLARRVTTALRGAYGRHAVQGGRPAVEELLIGVLNERVSERRAVAAFTALSAVFVDWNEARVSSPHDIAAVIEDVPDALEKADAIRAVLRNIFDRVNEISLEFLREAPPHETVALIQGIPDFPEFALARATLVGLGHDVMPLTPKVAMVCKRIGLLDGGNDLKALNRRIERLVPKQNMVEFHWLLSRHAEEACLNDPAPCDDCVLHGCCKAGQRADAKKRAARARRKAALRKSARAKTTGKKATE